MQDFKVAIIGLGYVGLPLAVESGKHYLTIGFDINPSRIAELKHYEDRTLEVEPEELKSSENLSFTSNAEELKSCNFFVVTVPTPVDDHKKPDLTPLLAASKTIAPFITKGAIVVYESTVYPGCTEDVCVPVLEKGSGLKFNQDFYVGYSPERINPGDKEHRLTTILKVTSGSTPEIAEKVDEFYASFVEAGTYKASSIKVAEAAKVIENTQRDINIAFVNELALIFGRMGLDTREVLEAAGTKWNFLKFMPGLVGGHCIGVDPYYLTYKAEELGYHPQVILSGRKINDGMGAHVAQQTIKLLSQKARLSPETKVLILGITFKENCPDIRNSRVIDIYRELEDYNIRAEVFDPHAERNEVVQEYGVELLENLEVSHYSAVIVAVGHQSFLDMDWQTIRKKVDVIYDVKGLLARELVDSRL
ncbi:nucleotide sugar dehydrogenase [Marinoscillum furvescens]|uniref:UDP-N-acetyl-D-galactosamine dehydrogenase n=1 Tax=Marinoscillum furvescens DSM 4134 TaxID=1122208 RepID=A0A3D9L646_MARFU|nr:nucleotide sugar dehydrogenase [Marinoscillum furvescens]REE01650.1 UDP-N-acetyl-D-galactosamine dehydrogenase [Marinoscillum furvescens DSM 4134]